MQDIKGPEIVSLAAHDLGNALGTILLQISLLQAELEPDTGPEAEQRIQDIKRSGERIKRLLRGMVLLAPALEQRLPTQVDEINAVDVLQQAIATEAAAGRPVTMHVAEEAIQLNTDRERLLDVLGGVLDAAYRFSRVGEQTETHAFQRGERCYFAVSPGRRSADKQDLEELLKVRSEVGGRGGIRLVLYMAQKLGELIGAEISVGEVESGKPALLVSLPLPTRNGSAHA